MPLLSAAAYTSRYSNGLRACFIAHTIIESRPHPAQQCWKQKSKRRSAENRWWGQFYHHKTSVTFGGSGSPTIAFFKNTEPRTVLVRQHHFRLFNHALEVGRFGADEFTKLHRRHRVRRAAERAWRATPPKKCWPLSPRCTRQSKCRTGASRRLKRRTKPCRSTTSESRQHQAGFCAAACF